MEGEDFFYERTEEVLRQRYLFSEAEFQQCGGNKKAGIYQVLKGTVMESVEDMFVSVKGLYNVKVCSFILY